MWAATLARFFEYAGATGLFGTALFYLALLPPQGNASAGKLGWPKPLLIVSGLCLVLGTALSLAAQAATMNGIDLDKLDWPSVSVVLSDTQWGHAIAVRLVLSLVALLIAIVLKPSGLLWRTACALGAVILASFAWTGHGASTEGVGSLVHLLADIAHLIAAGVWLGALAAFLALLCLPKTDGCEQQMVLFKALKNFSGLGSTLVAVLVVSGLINSYFLVGFDHLTGLFASPYSILLLIKLAIFILMLGLAAKNRFYLTPALGHALEGNAALAEALSKLKRSVLIESLAGLAVLGLVSAIGMLEPLIAE